MNERFEKMNEMRQKGLSYQSIGRLFNISRARAHQILSGYNSPAFFQSKKQKLNTAKEKDKERKMILIRDNFTCKWGERCKGEKVDKNKLVIHHIDFDDRNNNPNNLIVLCNKCHLFFHKKNHIDSDIEKRLQK